ncbi:MAG: riboflavin synthase [Blastocatellia bacterium AA13]|nr:MAG: riboflavin synthase [Blastocatellia bacterium AA13]
MFTGLIMETGRVKRIDRRADGALLVIEAKTVLDGTKIGDSISINGVDLTVIEMSDGWFSSDASLETLNRSTLGGLRAGDRVNLERALAVGERLGGHMVQGHVDGTAEFLNDRLEGNAHRMRFRLPLNLAHYVAMKGSITIDGISLTVAALGSDWFEVVIIPHTWRETTLSTLKSGSRVNIEVDVLAKYVERLLSHDEAAAVRRRQSELTVEELIEQGY